MNKFFVKPRFRPCLLGLLFLILIFPARPGFSGSGASIIISSAEGKPGDTVEITVSMKDIAGLVGVDGLTGGEIEIAYDPSLATVTGVKTGPLLAGALFVYNMHYRENSIFVCWVSSDEILKKDGILCIITFTLKQTALLAPTITSLSICDQHLQVLEARGAGSGSSSVTLHWPEDLKPFNPPDQGNGTAAPGDAEEPHTGDQTKSAARWLPVSLGVLLIILAAGITVIYLNRRHSRIQN